MSAEISQTEAAPVADTTPATSSESATQEVAGVTEGQAQETPHDVLEALSAAAAQKKAGGKSNETLPDGAKDQSEDNTALAEKARELGMSEETFTALGENASKVIADLESAVFKKALAAGEGKPADAAVEKAESKPVVMEPAKEVSGGMKDAISALLKEAAFEEDDAIYASMMKVAEAQDSAMAMVLQKMGEFEQKLSSGDSAVQAAQQQQRDMQIDQFFIGMKDRYAEVLGDKPIGEYDASSPEAVKRNEILEKAHAIIVGMKAMGNKEPTLQVALEQAAKICLADHDKKIARSEIENKMKKRQDSIVGKPGVTVTPERGPMTRDEEIAEAAATLRELAAK